jgi:hypothetical protein
VYHTDYCLTGFDADAFEQHEMAFVLRDRTVMSHATKGRGKNKMHYPVLLIYSFVFAVRWKVFSKILI